MRRACAPCSARSMRRHRPCPSCSTSRPARTLPEREKAWCYPPIGHCSKGSGTPATSFSRSSSSPLKETVAWQTLRNCSPRQRASSGANGASRSLPRTRPVGRCTSSTRTPSPSRTRGRRQQRSQRSTPTGLSGGLYSFSTVGAAARPGWHSSWTRPASTSRARSPGCSVSKASLKPARRRWAAYGSLSLHRSGSTTSSTASRADRSSLRGHRRASRYA